jgi:hypothetical protein
MCVIAAPLAADGSPGSRHARVLADLAAEIVTCSVHPCLGDTVKQLRDLLQDAIVTDGVFYFSEVATAYPSVQGTLQGLVEWDLDDGIDAISIKVTHFHVDPEDFVAKLVKVLPGCEVAWENENGGDVTDEEIPMVEASCSVTDDESRGIDVAAYFAPGLLILEIYD